MSKQKRLAGFNANLHSHNNASLNLQCTNNTYKTTNQDRKKIIISSQISSKMPKS